MRDDHETKFPQRAKGRTKTIFLTPSKTSPTFMARTHTELAPKRSRGERGGGVISKLRQCGTVKTAQPFAVKESSTGHIATQSQEPRQSEASDRRGWKKRDHCFPKIFCPRTGGKRGNQDNRARLGAGGARHRQTIKKKLGNYSGAGPDGEKVSFEDLL